MSDLAWTAEVSAKCPGAVLAIRESAPGEAELRVAPDRVLELLRVLRSEPYAFTFLSDLTAYDEQPATPRFHVVYELISMLRHLRCSVIAPLGDDLAPSVASVTALWPGANWLEREVFDMFGIDFQGHPDLRRLLLPQQFVGYPLRKDFIVDYRQDFPESQEVVAVPGAEFFGKGVLEGGE